jgi:hypothetical protein
MRDIGRRRFLAVAAFAPLLGVRRQAAARADLDGFLALSARLTGRADLDPDLGRAYLAALQAAPPMAPLLRQLVAGTPAAERTPPHEALERAIVASWYTGVCEVDGHRRVITHAGALMWQVLGRPAPGLCAGPTGAWGSAPTVA